MTQTAEDSAFTPPYMSFETFRNFVLKLNPHAMPPRIDRSMMVGMAGGTQTALMQLLKQFELIKGVSEGLSFRQLADQMSLSQPAISKMAREMEDALGAAVFERRRDGVSLTPFGESLTHDARLIVNKLARLE